MVDTLDGQLMLHLLQLLNMLINVIIFSNGKLLAIFNRLINDSDFLFPLLLDSISGLYFFPIVLFPQLEYAIDS